MRDRIAGPHLQTRVKAATGVAGAIKAPDMRAFALTAAADELAREAKKQAAQVTAKEAQALASGFTSDITLSQAFLQLAAVFAMLHQYKDAMTPAEACRQSNERWKTYKGTLRECAVQRRPKLAPGFDDPHKRSSTAQLFRSWMKTVKF